MGPLLSLYPNSECAFEHLCFNYCLILLITSAPRVELSSYPAAMALLQQAKEYLLESCLENVALIKQRSGGALRDSFLLQTAKAVGNRGMWDEARHSKSAGAAVGWDIIAHLSLCPGAALSPVHVVLALGCHCSSTRAWEGCSGMG